MIRIRWALLCTLALLLLGIFEAPLSAQRDAAASDLGPPGGASVPTTSVLLELELTSQTRQSLLRLVELWDQWNLAYYQDDAERSASLVEQIAETSKDLGMTHLPDLALAAQVRALEAARAGDFSRSRWALGVAGRLDPERPENDFVRGRVDWRSGNYPLSLFHSMRGVLRLLGMPGERRLVATNLVLWLLGVILLAGVLFGAVQMASKGGGLIRDLSALFGRLLPPWLAAPLALAVLVWPVLLPYGPLWLILYWSVLVWGYGSPSERAVLLFLWVLLGATPFMAHEVQSVVWEELSPSVRVLHEVRAGRLSGSLFSDLEALRTQLPESTAVRHLVADLHQVLGQWDLARSLYGQVLQEEPEAVSVLLNLGAYYFFTNDFGSAADYFQQAATRAPGEPAAYYNLAQAYSEQYYFDESQVATARARELDNEQVSAWLKRTGRDRIITPLGGFARVGEIRRELREKWKREEGARAAGRIQPLPSLLASVVLVIFAVVLHLTRRPFGYTQPPMELLLDRGLPERLLRAFLPGLEAAEVGEGGRAFFVLILPVALLMLPLGGLLTFPLPLGASAGGALPWTIATLGLVIFFGVRLARELRRGL